MIKHPFNEGTKLAKIFEILADNQWHCGKHELPGTQPAKAIQIIRQNGFDIVKETRYCEICKDKTVHRRLISNEPIKPSINRIAVPEKLRKRILNYYGNIEAISLRKMQANELEVDHRFPQVRWRQDEDFDPNMSDKEMQKRFQLLTRQNNLWKSRYCEHCKKTGERGTFIGINYFYAGDERWPSDIPSDDEHGCYGCFWYSPEEWRDNLNSVLKDAP
ncbi:MAG: hypothetical protein HY257_01940 [Chloroflexi bacterium]|nr:hypothetical protein [Chloroflexota bacterium]